MHEPVKSLAAARVLVLEDDYYLATDLQIALEGVGAVVVGPFANGRDAQMAVEQAPPDCALLDVNLGAGPSFELPRLLQRLSVPFAFVTGYDRSALPDEFNHVICFQKPLDSRSAVKAAAQLIGRTDTREEVSGAQRPGQRPDAPVGA